MVLAISKIYGNYQTTIPKEIREKCNINKEYLIEWDVTEEGTPIINFRKKRNIKDLIGAFHLKYETNSVELKKSLYK